MTTETVPRHLYRSRHDQVVAGVCGGLAAYFAIDPVIVRLAFIVITFAGGSGVLAYLIMMIVIPEEPVASSDLANPGKSSVAKPPSTDPGIVRRNRQYAALFLIAVGLAILVSNIGWFSWFQWNFFWPLVLVALGAALLFEHQRTR